MNTNTIERDAEEFRLNVLAIAGQSLKDKERKIQELQGRLDLLEGVLTRVSGQRVPQAQPAETVRPAPRRWSVR
jgi:hypothetical protein